MEINKKVNNRPTLVTDQKFRFLHMAWNFVV